MITMKDIREAVAKRRALSRLLKIQEDARWACSDEREAWFATELEDAKKAIRDLGEDPDAMVIEHVHSAAPKIRDWFAAEGIDVVARPHERGVFVDVYNRGRVDMRSGVEARFDKWLHTEGLCGREWGALEGRLGVETQIVIGAGPFKTEATNGHRVRAAAEDAVLAVGRCAVSHALPRARFAQTSTEKLKATCHRVAIACGTTGWPSRSDWDTWSG